MTILTVGIDLFAAHGVNDAGRAELVRPAMPRDELHELIASLPPLFDSAGCEFFIELPARGQVALISQWPSANRLNRLRPN
jgi:transposase